MSLKTNKSYTKRFKVLKSGKLKAMKPGFNHFNSKQSRTKQLSGKVGIEVSLNNKAMSRFMPYTK